ncbi:MAG: hypothetical protein CML68_01000 [Rhodobacteraceae bacterium]|nr:hypothetical protein [Paracoccaceae bacterium]
MTPFIKIVTTAVAMSAIATLAAASDAPARVLKIPQGLCPQTVSAMTDWAAKANGSGIGAYAMPVDMDTKVGQCDTAKIAMGGVAYGYTSYEEAAAAATASCEAQRGADMGNCKVFAYLVDQK